MLTHSRGKKCKSLVFSFITVVHSDLTSLNVLYPNKMRGQLMSLRLPSYQHKADFNIT